MTMPTVVTVDRWVVPTTSTNDMLIDTDKVISKVEIAELEGVIPSAVSNWIRRFDDFPKPIVTLRIGDLYDRDEVLGWLNDRNAARTERAEKEIARLEARLARLKARGERK